MTEWITVKEAAELLKISRRQVLNRIHEKRLKAKRDGNKWLIDSSLEAPEEEIEEVPESSQNFQVEVEQLKQQLSVKDENIAGLQEEIKEVRRTSQNFQEEVERFRQELNEAEKKAALVDGLSADKESLQRQIESLQIQLQEASQRHDTVVMQMSKMLEYEQQPFWRRWFKQKALPAPGDVVDMEADTDKES